MEISSTSGHALLSANSPRVIILGSLCLGPPGAVLLLVFLLEMRNGARSTLRKGKVTLQPIVLFSQFHICHKFILTQSLPLIYSPIQAFLFGYQVRLTLLYEEESDSPELPLQSRDTQKGQMWNWGQKANWGQNVEWVQSPSVQRTLPYFYHWWEVFSYFLLTQDVFDMVAWPQSLSASTTAEDPEIHSHPSNLTGLPPTAAVLFMKWVTFIANPTANWCWIWHIHPTSFFSFSPFTCLSSSWRAALFC